jgi:hypothetical protein
MNANRQKFLGKRLVRFLSRKRETVFSSGAFFETPFLTSRRWFNRPHWHSPVAAYLIIFFALVRFLKDFPVATVFQTVE